jgi:hypothetical protein
MADADGRIEGGGQRGPRENKTEREDDGLLKDWARGKCHPARISVKLTKPYITHNSAPSLIAFGVLVQAS